MLWGAGPDNGPVELQPTHTMEWWDEAEVWGARGLEREGWLVPSSITWRSQSGGAGIWGRVVGTRAHPDWDHVAKQLDFFHGAAGK